MSNGYRILALGLMVVALGGVAGATAQTPELQVEPNSLNWTEQNNNSTVSANRDHSVQFNFSNPHENKTIYNVTLEDQSFITWNETGFDINNSSYRNVSADIFLPTPTYLEGNMTVPYKYNNTIGNDSEITFDKNYYPFLEFALETYWIETELETDTFDTEFTANLSEERSSVFKLENVGSETAYNVSLGGEYLSFDTGDGFNVTKTEDKFVSFQVVIPKPSDAGEATSATNQTYNTSIEVSGDNFNSTEIPVSVYVPFHNYTEDEEIGSTDELGSLFEDFQSYCREDPGRCNITETVVRNQTVNQTVVKYRESNLTKEEIQALKDLSNTTTRGEEATRERVDLLKHAVLNELEGLNESMQERLSTAIKEAERAQRIANQTNNTVYSEIEQENRQEESAQRVGIMMAVAFLVISLFVAIGYAGYKWVKAQNDWRVVR